MKWLMAIIIAAIVLAETTGAVTADPYDDAIAAYRRGDYATALQILRPLAERGSFRAQYTLAFAYTHGHGVPQNFVEAARWYRRSADQGWASAQINLANLYYEGKGEPVDYVSAYFWFALSASGDLNAKTKQGAIEGRDSAAKRLSEAQLAEAKQWVRLWKPRKER